MIALAAVAVTIPEAAGATSLPSTITSNTTLTAAGSPYTGSYVTVDSGVTVTVDPGARVEVYYLNVNGTLDVNGTSGSPAVFTSSSDSAPGQWLGIDLNTSSSSIDHAKVRFTNNFGIELGSGVSASITNSEIYGSANSGIETNRGAPTITGNEIHDNGGIGINAFAGVPEISGNNIHDNAGSANKGGGINYEICNCSSITGEVSIHDNTVTENGGDAGIRVFSGFSGGLTGTTIGDNTITDNAGKGLSYFARPAWGGEIPTDVATNTIDDNGLNGAWVAGTIADSATWDPDGYPLVLNGTAEAATRGDTRAGARVRDEERVLRRHPLRRPRRDRR